MTDDATNRADDAERTASQDFETPSTRRIRHSASRWLGRVAFAALFVPWLVTAFLLCLPGTPIPMPSGIATMLLTGSFAAPFAALLGLLVGAGTSLGAGRAVVERDSVRIETGPPQSGRRKTRHVSRDAIVAGLETTRAGVPGVILHLRGGDEWHLATRSFVDARRLLDALGLDVEHRRATVSLGSAARRIASLSGISIAAIVGACVAFGHSLSVTGTHTHASSLAFAAALLGALLLITVAAGFTRPAEVVVGADGVKIFRNGRSRFIPHDQIAAVDTPLRELRLTLVNGEVVSVRSRLNAADSAAAIEAVSRRIRAAKAQPDVERTGATLAMLARADAPVATWAAKLRGLVASAEAYRTTGVPREKLVDLLAADDATVEVRIAAALALTAEDSVDGRDRVRIAAEATANDRLRVALAKIADGDPADDAIERAMTDANAVEGTHRNSVASRRR